MATIRHFSLILLSLLVASVVVRAADNATAVSGVTTDDNVDDEFQDGEMVEFPVFGKKAATVKRLCRSCARKRGMGWGLKPEEMRALRLSTRWWYNWGGTASPEAIAAGEQNRMRFVPQAWGGWWPNLDTIADKFPVFSDGTRPNVLIGFNEPNHGEQSNMSPEWAASLWPKVEAAADRYGMRITSPAVAPCGANCRERDAMVWLDKFFEACRGNANGGCRVDIICVHYYVGWEGSACDPGGLQWYIQRFKKYGKPIWLKEFGCMNNGGWPRYYHRAALDYLDFEPAVERHAWWAPRFKVGGAPGEGSLLMPDSADLTKVGALWTKYGVKRGYTRRIRRQPNNRPGGGRSGPFAAGTGRLAAASAKLAAKAGELKDAGAWDAFCAPCASTAVDLDYAAASPPRRAAGNGTVMTQEAWDALHARCGACGYGPSPTPVPKAARDAAKAAEAEAQASGGSGAVEGVPGARVAQQQQQQQQPPKQPKQPKQQPAAGDDQPAPKQQDGGNAGNNGGIAAPMGSKQGKESAVLEG